MKTSKKIISMLLCLVMVASTFCGLGLVLDDFVAEAADVFNPNITITNTHTNSAGTSVTVSITQQRVVGTTDNAYLATYQEYQNKLLGGKMTNSPTNFVVPGLSASDNYIPQGLAYWEEKDWFLISAHDKDSETPSVIYVLDGQTAEFIKLIVLLNTDGSDCMEHGGGLCCSEYNLYYTHSGSTIAYVPLDTVAKALEGKDSACVQFVDRRSLTGELNGASTSYCSYGSGTLWTGNFYYSDKSSFNTAGNASSNSILLGYKLYGNSSKEEWNYFRNGANIMKLNSTAQQSAMSDNTTMTYTTTSDDGATVDIAGTVTSDGTDGEITATFGTTKTSDTYWEESPLHNLTVGYKYRIEFDTNYRNTDFYLFAPGGKHTNIKYIADVTDNGDGTWHFKADFTPGTKPTGADSTWGTDEVNATNYTGSYSIRFDIDNPPSGTTNFRISNLSVRYVNSWVSNHSTDPLIGTSCVGNPYYVIAFKGGTNNIDKIQYAIHDQGKLYISRSYSRSETGEHIREFSVGYVDLNAPGDTDITVNGRLRKGYLIHHSENFQLFGGSGSSADDSDSAAQEMFHMGEGLVAVGDNIYIISESGADEYMNHSTGTVSKCPQPIDVMWKIDHHELLNEEKSYDDTAALCYQKVNDLSEINAYDDYIIVHKSPVKDSLTQNNYLYALDSYGGYGDRYLPKYSDTANSPSQMGTGDSMGVVGYEIKDYEIETEDGKELLYITEEDDAYTSIRWNITAAGTDTVKIDSKELHFASNKHFNFGQRLFTMMADGSEGVNNMRLDQYNGEKGNFVIYNSGGYYLWCNDGSNQSYIDTYTNYYKNHSALGYLPNYNHLTELAGTFHADAKRQSTDGGNLTGGDVGADMMIVNIYKRVTDPYSSVYNSRIYSDLRAELQADGTYNIVLETYANSPLQYQTLDADRPTDFIFVLDASGSMSSGDTVGYQIYSSVTGGNTIKANELNPDDEDFKCNEGTAKYNLRNSDLYYQTDDGHFHPIYLSWYCYKYYQKNFLSDKQRAFNFYMYYISVDDGLYYMLSSDGVASTTGLTSDQMVSNIQSQTGYTVQGGLNVAKDNGNIVIYTGVHYKYRNGNCPRIDAIRNTIDDLSRKIANNAAETGLNHRIAVTTFGSSGDSYTNTNMYTNSSTTAIGYASATDANYKNAFYDVADFASVRSIVNDIYVPNEDYCDGYSEFGLDMASKIVENSDSSYLGDGDRSVAIIMITDGVPGRGSKDSATQANTAASNAIANALRAKNLGAYVYTVQIGANAKDGFNMDEYMDFTSSKYLFAEDMYNPGDKNISDIVYRIDVPTGTSFNLDSIVNGVFDAVQSNSKNAMAKLSETSVIREKLNDSFIIPSTYTVKTETASIYYDELERLHWKDPVSSSLTTSVDSTSREIIVDGFDYSANCVTPSNEANGKKLIVTISGVLANTEKELDNTSINVYDNTGIYETREKMTANDAVKRFPTEHFSIPEYNFIMDYDLPMYDSEVNGTLCSVDSTIRKQDINNYSEELDIDNINIKFANGNQDLIYTLKQDEDKGYVLIKRDDGTYDWFRINIIPASNVYYEETRMEAVTSADSLSRCSWTSSGTAGTGYQDTSTDADVYGYDGYYNNANDYSNNSYKTATVRKENPATETLEFEFTGKGFDLVSACGADTGILLVAVRNGGDLEKVFVVDTYYSDTTYGNITQVPVLHYVTDTYATRTVQVTGVYLADFYEPEDSTAAAALDIEGDEVDMSVPAEELGMFAAIGLPEFDEVDDDLIEAVWMDENSVLNTASQAMATANAEGTYSGRPGPKTLSLDGYRVYNTLDDGMDTAYIASEQNARYYNVEDELKKGTFEDILSTFVAYVEGGRDGKDISFQNYTKSGIGGPAGEVYLEAGQAISFKVKDDGDGTTNVMIGMRNVSGNPTAKVGGSDITITSKTEMYYDVSTLLTGVSENGETVYTITVMNNGNGILAVNNIKLTNASFATTAAEDLPMVASLMMMSATPVDSSELNGTVTYANQHPDYIPAEPGTTNPDPDLDPVSRPGDTKIDMGNIGDLIDNGSVTPASFLAALLEIFKKLFANIGKLIFSF